MRPPLHHHGRPKHLHAYQFFFAAFSSHGLPLRSHNHNRSQGVNLAGHFCPSTSGRQSLSSCMVSINGRPPRMALTRSTDPLVWIDCEVCYCLASLCLLLFFSLISSTSFALSWHLTKVISALPRYPGDCSSLRSRSRLDLPFQSIEIKDLSLLPLTHAHR